MFIMVVIMIVIMVVIMVIIIIIEKRGYRSSKGLKLNCFVCKLISRTDCSNTSPTVYCPGKRFISKLCRIPQWLTTSNTGHLCNEGLFGNFGGMRLHLTPLKINCTVLPQLAHTLCPKIIKKHTHFEVKHTLWGKTYNLFWVAWHRHRGYNLLDIQLLNFTLTPNFHQTDNQ